MNAVKQLIGCFPRRSLARLLEETGATPKTSGPSRTTAELREYAIAEFDLDLPRLLNLAVREELDTMAEFAKLELPAERNSIGRLRALLWRWGAELEAGNCALFGSELQPVPVVLRGKLVQMRAGSGAAPPTTELPRPVPLVVEAPTPEAEPDTLEELLDNAQAILGVRLGAATRDKGAFGTRIAELLGVRELNVAEPDWRGDVEIKTVPVVHDTSGWWRVKEDPAISMEDVDPMSKLLKVLWIARVADADDSPILSWYYQECDRATRELCARDLHTRPKGGAGATTRGWYLHKRFFADSGFLRSLNG